MTFNREILGGGGGTRGFTASGGCTMQMRENRPQKKHPKRGINGIPKGTLNKSHGPISTS